MFVLNINILYFVIQNEQLKAMRFRFMIDKLIILVSTSFKSIKGPIFLEKYFLNNSIILSQTMMRLEFDALTLMWETFKTLE